MIIKIPFWTHSGIVFDNFHKNSYLVFSPLEMNLILKASFTKIVAFAVSVDQDQAVQNMHPRSTLSTIL